MLLLSTEVRREETTTVGISEVCTRKRQSANVGLYGGLCFEVLASSPELCAGDSEHTYIHTLDSTKPTTSIPPVPNPPDARGSKTFVVCQEATEGLHSSSRLYSGGPVTLRQIPSTESPRF